MIDAGRTQTRHKQIVKLIENQQFIYREVCRESSEKTSFYS
jgi:hypothetical protein